MSNIAIQEDHEWIASIMESNTETDLKIAEKESRRTINKKELEIAGKLK